MKKRLDVHEEITNKIVAAIEAGAGDFKLPWHRPAASLQRPVSVATGKPYHGINVVTLWIEAQMKGYAVPVWGTYKAFQDKGAQVRKGEKASLVVYYKELEFQREDAKPDDADQTRSAWMARGYWVFNAEQCDGYPLPDVPAMMPVARNADVERFIDNAGIEVRWGGTAAYYKPSDDYIAMPDAGLFTGTSTSSAEEAMAATLLHEGIHATGHKKRLDRDFTARFSTEARAREELCADLGSAFLCADLGVTPHLRDDHAQYLQHWLAIMKGDVRAIFTAAAAANKAAEYLHSLQHQSSI